MHLTHNFLVFSFDAPCLAPALSAVATWQWLNICVSDGAGEGWRALGTARARGPGWCQCVMFTPGAGHAGLLCRQHGDYTTAVTDTGTRWCKRAESPRQPSRAECLCCRVPVSLAPASCDCHPAATATPGRGPAEPPWVASGCRCLLWADKCGALSSERRLCSALSPGGPGVSLSIVQWVSEWPGPGS